MSSLPFLTPLFYSLFCPALFAIWMYLSFGLLLDILPTATYVKCFCLLQTLFIKSQLLYVHWVHLLPQTITTAVSWKIYVLAVTVSVGLQVALSIICHILPVFNVLSWYGILMAVGSDNKPPDSNNVEWFLPCDLCGDWQAKLWCLTTISCNGLLMSVIIHLLAWFAIIFLMILQRNCW